MRSSRLLAPTILAAALTLAACSDAPEEASIDTAASQAADDGGADGASDGGGDEDTDTAGAEVSTMADLEGTWTVVAGDADAIDAGTFVGYRVQEELRGVGDTTAVGRTPGVEGELVIADGIVTEVDITADLTMLASDSSNRDGAIRNNGLETNEFPSGQFVLTSELEIPESAVDGESFTAPVTGELTLHGQTVDVAFDLDAQLVDGTTIVAVAQIDIVMSDFGITPPQLGPVLSIADEGVAELQLRFTKA